MKEIITKVFPFDELDDSAKEKAREWYRNGMEFDGAEYVYDDAVHMGALLGIEIAMKPVRLMGGGTRDKPVIYYSGFCSQGDGACFEGRYSYKKGAAAAVEKETGGTDKEIVGIAMHLQNIQKAAFYRLTANCVHRGHYYHSGYMSVSVYKNDYVTGNDLRVSDWEDQQITQALRDFADWIYKRLEESWDYENSDEVVGETITANEYTFTGEGKRFG